MTMTTQQLRNFRLWQIEQKRTEMFNAWLARTGETEKLTTSEMASRRLGFDAALDALVLPAREDDADGDRFAQGFNHALEQIQSIGLGLKVKP